MSCKKRSECTHHWMIESPNGRQSLGICKYCDAEKYFPTAQSDEEIIRASGFNSGSTGPIAIQSDERPIAQPAQRIKD